jgi:Ankyrin repeats (3 copies)
MVGALSRTAWELLLEAPDLLRTKRDEWRLATGEAREEKSREALYLALKQGDLPKVKSLIRVYPSFARDRIFGPDQTALMVAVLYSLLDSNKNIVEFLLSSGADKTIHFHSVIDPSFYRRQGSPGRVQRVAEQNRNPKIVELLHRYANQQ